MKFKHLRSNFPLIIQILIVIFASLSLADPIWLSPSNLAGNTVLVLDTSASMLAKAESESRIEVAKKMALELVEGVTTKKQIALLETGTMPFLLSRFSDDKDHLTKIISNLKVKEVPGDLKKVSILALSFIRNNPNNSILILTDGADPQLQEVKNLDPRISIRIIEGGEDNVAITQFSFRRELKDSNKIQLFLNIKNYNQEAVLSPLEITVDEYPVFNESVGLDALESRSFIIPLQGLKAGKILARLKRNDDFTIDNRAFAVLNRSTDIYVQLFTKGNVFLERVLTSYPNVILNKSPEILDDSWQQQLDLNHLVIVDNMPAPTAPNGNLVFINHSNPALPLVEGPKIKFPQVTSWDRQHPLLKELNIHDLLIQQAKEIESFRGAKPILQSNKTDLVFTVEKEKLRAVYFGFDLKESDFPLKVAFPIFWNNLMNWMIPAIGDPAYTHFQTGSSIPLLLKPQTKEILVRTPDRRRINLPVKQQPFIFNDTGYSGIYKIREGKSWFYFATNLLNENESNILPKQFSPKDENSVFNAIAQENTKRKIWFLVLILVALFLMFEWFVWSSKN